VAVLFGATDTRAYGDTGVYRQDLTFFYLTGVELPGAVLVLEPSRDTLFLPMRRPAVEAWFGPRFGPDDDTARLLGFDRVLDCEPHDIVIDARRRPQPGVADRIANLVSGGTLWLAFPPASAAGALTPEQRFAVALRERLPEVTVRDLSPLLTEMRAIKEEGEIALIRKAVAASIEAVRAVAGAVRPGRREGELEGVAFAALKAAGAEGWAFPPIIGSGLAGAVLHYDANLGSLCDGELVVVDIGARHGYYCGDLSRTFPVSGRFSPRQRALYDTVLAAYGAAVSTLRPGSTLTAARKAAFDALEASPLSSPDGQRLGQSFIHGIGHGVGLAEHDVGTDATTLAPGMVVTIEPGIYLPDEATGIRVEDMFLITPAGAENLSSALPHDRESVERMTLAGRADTR
jgi:Xaa-Pro aminopeptidase